jgi:MFS family permease
MSEIIYPKYRWFVLLTLSIVNAVSVMILVAPATIIGEISKTLGIGLGETTAVTMVIINIFVAISALLGGTIIDRVGAYRVWTTGTGLLILGSILVPVIGRSSTGMLIIRAVHGCGIGPILASLPLVVTQWFAKKERVFIFAIQGIVASLGGATVMSFIPFVFQKTGSWQAAMFWMIIFHVTALLLSLTVLFGPKPPAKDHEAPSHGIDLISKEMKEAFLLPSTWSALICIFLFNWVVRIFNDLIPGYLAIDQPIGVGMGSFNSGKLMSGVYLATMLGLIIGGIIMEKMLKGRPTKLVMTGFIVPAILWYSIKFPGIFSDAFVLSACVLLGGFSLSFTSPLIMAFVAKNYPEHIMGKLGGLITLCIIIGSMSGTATGSYALHVTGLYHVPINLLSLGAFLGFLSAIFLKEPKVFLSG